MEYGKGMEYGGGGSKLKSAGMPRDGKQKAGLESGSPYKAKITESNAALGLHSVGYNEKPGANPKVAVSRNHYIR